MDYAAGPPSQWLVTLRSGAVIELAADAYSEESGHALFSVLADATPEEQDQVHVLASSPMGGPRVIVLVAKIPMTEVAGIEGGWPWPAVQHGSTATDATPAAEPEPQ